MIQSIKVIKDGTTTITEYIIGADIFKTISSPSCISYFKNDRLHNETGPASKILLGNNAGTESYYINGILHRVGGPALIEVRSYDVIPSLYTMVYKKEVYYEGGKMHRLDGPAYTYIHENVSNPSLAKTPHYDKAISISSTPRPMPLFKESTYKWYRRGSLHRVDGPAVIQNDSWRQTLGYYKSGVRHRIDGPALIKRGYNNKLEVFWAKSGKTFKDKFEWLHSLTPAQRIAMLTAEIFFEDPDISFKNEAI